MWYNNQHLANQIPHANYVVAKKSELLKVGVCLVKTYSGDHYTATVGSETLSWAKARLISAALQIRGIYYK